MITIDSNIPLPTTKAGRTRRFDMPLQSMKPNDSFIVMECNNIPVAYSTAMQRNIIGMIKTVKIATNNPNRYLVRKWVDPDGVALVRVYMVG